MMAGASGMAARVHAEKAVSAEEEQEWQVLMKSVGRKIGRLERTSTRRRKRGKMRPPRGENGQ